MNTKIEEQSAVAVVRFLIAVAHADGRLDAAESALLRKAIAQLPVSDENKTMLEAEIESPPEVTDAAARLERDEDKMFVLSHALQVAHADGECSSREREKIVWLAGELGVSDVALQELEHHATSAARI